MSKIHYLPDLLAVTQILNNLPESSLIIIADRHVYRLYGEQLFANLSKAHVVWCGPAGAKMKTLACYQRCLDALLKTPIQRKNCHVVAVGGGSCSDFAGFIAHTLFRGVAWSVIPTTLLAMVDAAIGGKVALDHPAGKNLIGAFHLPRQILICEHFLATLSARDLISAKGELVKYGMLHAPIAKLLLSDSLSLAIQQCGRFKSRIVARDLYDQKNIREQLNWGHTFGHALEQTFGLAHGMAVLVGLRWELEIVGATAQLKTRYSQLVAALGLTSALQRSEQRIRRHWSPAVAQQVRAQLKFDKKNERDTIRVWKNHDFSMAQIQQFFRRQGCPL